MSDRWFDMDVMPAGHHVTIESSQKKKFTVLLPPDATEYIDGRLFMLLSCHSSQVRRIMLARANSACKRVGRAAIDHMRRSRYKAMLRAVEPDMPEARIAVLVRSPAFMRATKLRSKLLLLPNIIDVPVHFEHGETFTVPMSSALGTEIAVEVTSESMKKICNYVAIMSAMDPAHRPPPGAAAPTACEYSDGDDDEPPVHAADDTSDYDEPGAATDPTGYPALTWGNIDGTCEPAAKRARDSSHIRDLD